MALVSIAEAAKLVGKSRKTLYNATQSGRVSFTQDETGAKLVDTSELIRVYGKLLHKGDSVSSVKITHGETPNETVVTAAKMAALEAENFQLKERLADKEKNLEDLRSTVRLLEHKQARSWWKIW
jgi:hypothetical protein